MIRRGTIACVIVTYNRKKLLFDGISAVKAQTYGVNRLIVVDNASNDGSWDALLTSDLDARDLHRMDANLGGAGGFHYGMQKALETGCDWIWVMDDDAIPEHNCLEALLESPSAEDRSNILCPVIYGSDGLVQKYHHKYIAESDLSEECIDPDILREGSDITINANAFVGPIFSRDVLVKFGLPKAEYFIWCDDLEFTYRAGGRGRNVRLIPAARINHMDVKYSGDLPAAWKSYYLYRNRLDFLGSHLSGSKKFKAIAAFIGNAIIQSLRWLKQGERPHAFVAIKGVFDYCRGKMGKVYDGSSFRS